mgnify:CR=1 FL=1
MRNSLRAAAEFRAQVLADEAEGADCKQLCAVIDALLEGRGAREAPPSSQKKVKQSRFSLMASKKQDSSHQTKLFESFNFANTNHQS